MPGYIWSMYCTVDHFPSRQGILLVYVVQILLGHDYLHVQVPTWRSVTEADNPISDPTWLLPWKRYLYTLSS